MKDLRTVPVTAQWQVLRELRDWEWKEFGLKPYNYELEVSDRLILAAVLGGLEIAVAVSRQAGKTTAVVWTIAFLMRYMPELTGTFWACGFFTPQREQVKTDRDRLLNHLRKGMKLYEYTVAEANSNTLRIAYGDNIIAECFLFGVSPTSHPESKTLNMAIVEEAHKLNEKIFDNDIRPMLASTNGSIIRTGVAGTQVKKFKSLLASKLAYQADDRVVLAEKRAAFERTADPYHLRYPAFLEAEKVRLGGEDSIPYKLNYRLEWCIGKGSFATPELLAACRVAPVEWQPSDHFEWVSFSIDHARNHDRTWIMAIGKKTDWDKPRLIHCECVPLGMDYDTQAERFVQVYRTFTNMDTSVIVPDCTGQGDFMADAIMKKLGYSAGGDSDASLGMIRYKFTSQGKDETAKLLQQAVKYATVGLPDAPTPDEIAFEKEMLNLELHMNGLLMTWHAPESMSETMDGEEPHDDACATFMLGLVGVARLALRTVPNIRSLA